MVKAFPGHKIKIISFIEYVKKVCLSNTQTIQNKNMANNHNNNNKSSFYHVTGNLKKTSQSAATKRFASVSKIPKKPKSVETLRTKNKIIKSFAKSNENNYGFGFDYYLSENESNNKAENKILSEVEESVGKSYKNEQINNINEQIDKMLNFYISKLNENIEDSFDSLECEEMGNSKLIISNKDLEDKHQKINELENKISKDGEVHTYTPISDINLVPNRDFLDLVDKSATNLEIKDVESGNKVDKQNYSSHSDDLEVDYSNLLNEEENESRMIDKKEAMNNIINSEINTIAQDKSNSNLEEKIELAKNFEAKNNNLFNIESKEIHLSTEIRTNKINNNILIIEENNTNQNFVCKKNNHNEVNTESDPYAHIRLTKSYEKEYARQNIDQFDIEYMCRCLGLALMKHLESGNEKGHIMELINFKENFSFFNSLFNSNLDFFFTFFNMENQDKISNLDKIDINEYKKSNSKNEPSNNPEKIIQIEMSNKPISFFSHVESTSNYIKENIDSNFSEIKNEKTSLSATSKLEKHKNISLQDKGVLDKDLKLINEFFNPQQNYPNYLGTNHRYSNVNETTKKILNQELNSINELDSIEYCKNNLLLTIEHKKETKEKTNNQNMKPDYVNLLRQSAAEFVGLESNEVKPDSESCKDNTDLKILINNENKFSNYDIVENITEEACLKTNQDATENSNKHLESEDIDDYYYKDTPLLKIQEEIVEKEEPEFESGIMESNYIFDITSAEKLKNFLMKTAEIYDDDYNYGQSKITHKRYAPMPDPNQIYEFCANIIISTKMEKEVIIICLIYIERFIFNTGILMNSRNWRRLIFTALIIASKIWDDDSFENNHFAQVFTHLSVGEINQMERSFLELINYKVYIKCSEYFKYFFIIKSIALKYNYNGYNLVPISMEKMMILQEYAHLMQKRLRKKYSHSNSANF